MDDSGRIYRRCKCGEEVTGDRDCPKCGAESTVADDLSEQLRGLIQDEVPDPLGAMREQLRSRHQKLTRKARKGK